MNGIGGQPHHVQEYNGSIPITHHMTHREREVNFSPQQNSSIEKLNLSQTQKNFHENIHSTPLMNNNLRVGANAPGHYNSLNGNNSSMGLNPENFNSSMSNVGSNQKLFDQFFKQNQNSSMNGNTSYTINRQPQSHLNSHGVGGTF